MSSIIDLDPDNDPWYVTSIIDFIPSFNINNFNFQQSASSSLRGGLKVLSINRFKKKNLSKSSNNFVLNKCNFKYFFIIYNRNSTF